MALPTAGPWEYENIQQPHDQSAYGVVKDANGKVLFDSVNSDVAEIHEEHDEDGVTRWDETGRRNLTLAAAAPDLLAACEAISAAVDGGSVFLSSAIAAAELARAAIAKATGGAT